MHAVVYVNHIVLCCSGRGSEGKAVRNTLQWGLESTSRYFSAIGLAFSPSKTSSIAYHSRQRLQDRNLPLILDGQQIQRVRHHRYLGVIMDHRIDCRLDLPSPVGYATPFLRDDVKELPETCALSIRGLILPPILYPFQLVAVPNR